MGQRSARLRQQLATSIKVSDAAQAALLRAEDRLSELESREQDRARRDRERIEGRS
jgi:hypothetical protein